MAKRKREMADSGPAAGSLKSRKEHQAAPTVPPASKSKGVLAHAAQVNGNKSTEAGRDGSGETATTSTIQVVTGSYEKVLHGFTATYPTTLVTGARDPPREKEQDESTIDFSDTFLFSAHTSAIRCLALSPPSEDSSKITLATGSTDERINLYSLSTAPPAPSRAKPKLPTLHGTSTSENSRNKELGSLLHHSSSITALYFPTRSKLLSSAQDSTIAITRTRDWTPLSTIKAPIPKPQGRPSGDTAAPGEVPSGINDFAVHPSMKLMVSVGKGEKCMRLWNLVTGKKAGVLNFGKEVLVAAGEGRFGSGEGQRVIWDAEGEEFVVAFERGAVVFGIDSKPKARILPSPRTKLHQMHYLPDEGEGNVLAVSTEDGRILFYDTARTFAAEDAKKEDIPPCTLLAQLGGPAAGIAGRVKDFEVLTPSSQPGSFVIVTGSSDGSVRIWGLQRSELEPKPEQTSGKAAQSGFTASQVGRLLGTYSTGTRITCLKAFLMTGKAEDVEEEEEEEEPVKWDTEASSSEEEE